MKKVIKLCPFMHLDDKYIEKYLEQQSEKGLHLWAYSYGGLIFFERGEAKKRKYTITKIDEEAELLWDYVNLTEDSGWKLVQASKGFQIFVTENTNTCEINTDHELQCEHIKRSLKKNEISYGVWSILGFVVILWLLNVFDGFGGGFDPILIPALIWGTVNLVRGIERWITVSFAEKNHQPIRILRRNWALFWGLLNSLSGWGTIAIVTGMAISVILDGNFGVIITIILMVLSALLSIVSAVIEEYNYRIKK